MNVIYADNAATTKLDIDAFEAMKPFLLDDYSNPSQPYSFSKKSRVAIKNAREIIAKCINAEPEEIYFTSGGSESDNWAIKGVCFNNIEKKAVITSEIEHHAVLNSCAAAEKLGYPVVYLNCDEKGVVSPNNLKRIIHSPSLVSVMMANNEIGTIQPIKELAEIAHEHGALFHTDAVQAVGHIPVDVNAIGIDMLSASAHKFNGPKGIGFLYIKKNEKLAPLINGGSQEKSMRAGTENVAGIVGMAVALQKNIQRLGEHKSKMYLLTSCFYNILDGAGIDYIRNGDMINKIPGNISVSIRGVSGESILHLMDLKKICISTGSACDSVNTQISHVISAIGIPKEYENGSVRISFGWDNTEEEAQIVAKALVKSVLQINR